MKACVWAVILAALFLFPLTCAAETQQEVISIPEELAAGGVTLKVTDSGVEIETGAEEEPEPPLAPPGAGSVIENTESGGKEFFTITTAGENVFYLVVDRERETDNVFFLKPVTEADLFGLAGMPERPAVETQAPAPAESATEAAPAPKGGNSMGMLVMVLVILIVGGGAGYYFKIYRPKQQQTDSGDEYEADYVTDISDDYSAEQDYGGAWYDEQDGPERGEADNLSGGPEVEQPDKVSGGGE